MKILLYSINYYPEIVGIGKYTGELANWLAIRGHEVKVVCAPRYFPEWKIRYPSKNQYKTEIINGVKIYRAPLWVPAKPKGISRIIHLVSFAMTSIYPLCKQYRWRPDFIITIAPAMLCAPAAIIFSRICGKRTKSMIHLQDFEIDAAFELGLLRGNLIRKIARIVEKKLLKSFDCSSSISNAMVKKLHQKGLTKEKTFLFPNWVDLERIYPIKGKKSENSLYNHNIIKKKNVLIAMYSGSMNQKQDFKLLIDAIYQLSHYKEKIIWLIGGEGPSKDDVISQTKEIENVFIQPLQPEDKINEWLNLADIHLVPQKTGTSDLVLPSKILGMLASGKPIVATAPRQSELHNIVNETGICTKPGDSKAFANAILELIENPEKRRIYGMKARIYAQERFGKEKVLNELEKNLYKYKLVDEDKYNNKNDQNK